MSSRWYPVNNSQNEVIQADINFTDSSQPGQPGFKITFWGMALPAYDSLLLNNQTHIHNSSAKFYG